MWNNKKGVEKMRKFSKNEDACRMKVHWRCTCGTSNHFVDLYQASLKEKEKGIDINFVNHNDQMDTAQLDISDFYENPEENFKNMLGN